MKGLILKRWVNKNEAMSMFENLMTKPSALSPYIYIFLRRDTSSDLHRDNNHNSIYIRHRSP
jgi:hypothetical protein